MKVCVCHLQEPLHTSITLFACTICSQRLKRLLNYSICLQQEVCSHWGAKEIEINGRKGTSPGVWESISLLPGDKEASQENPTYFVIIGSLFLLKEHLLSIGEEKLAILKLGWSYDKFYCTTIRNLLKEVFQESIIAILVCILTLEDSVKLEEYLTPFQGSNLYQGQGRIVLEVFHTKIESRSWIQCSKTQGV